MRRMETISKRAALVDAVRAEITALPTYGYNRADALVIEFTRTKRRTENLIRRILRAGLYE